MSPAVLAGEVEPQPGPNSVSSNVIPSNYKIRIAPSPDLRSFDGDASITIEVKESVDSIAVNARDLTAKSAAITGVDGKMLPLDVAVDAGRQLMVFVPKASIPPGQYTLNVAWSGKIRTDGYDGLFSDSALYEEPKTSGTLLFTDFEPRDARRVFPGWDEPGFKASYDLSLVTKFGEAAIGNMPVASQIALPDGRTQVRFATTPAMPSYLLFFAAGKLDRLKSVQGSTEFHTYARTASIARTALALKTMTETTRWFETWFDEKYDLPKLDIVFAPNKRSSSSAMENWGAILTYEQVALTSHSSEYSNDGQVRLVVTHEVAHQWLGNLVSPKTWDHLWLNEGLTTWLQRKAGRALYPPADNSAEPFYDMMQGQRGKDLDLDNAPPMVSPVFGQPGEANPHAELTYAKGGALAAMLEDHAGPERWQAALRRYIKTHRRGNADTGDLIAAMEAEQIPRAREIVTGFTAQAGVPVVQVSGGICREGRQMLVLRQPSGRDLWTIPVRAQSASGPVARALLGKDPVSLDVEGCGPALVNTDNIGHYLVAYSPVLARTMAAKMAQVASVDQLMLVQDSLLLADNGLHAYGPALDFARSVSATAHPILLYMIAQEYHEMLDMLNGHPLERAKLAGRINDHLGPALENLGMASKFYGEAEKRSARNQLVRLLARTGYQPLANHAAAKIDFADISFFVNYRPDDWVMTYAAMAGASRENWLRARNSSGRSKWIGDVAPEKFLGYVRDPALRRQAVAILSAPEIKAGYRRDVLESLAEDSPEEMLGFAIRNKALLLGKDPGALYDNLLYRLATRSRQNASAAKLEAILPTLTEGNDKKLLIAEIANIRKRARKTGKRVPGLIAWLRQGGK